MRHKAAIFLYRALLRQARQQYERFGTQAISLRAPLDSAPGSWNSKATPGLQYQIETLETLVPGLAVLPQEHQLPLTLAGLRQLIRDNFKAQPTPNAAEAATQQQQHHHAPRGRPGRTNTEQQQQQQLSPLDQGFAALRALPQQVYLEACSSSRDTEGVLVEATSCFNPRADPFTSAGFVAGGSGSSSSSSSREQWFSYRIRVTNNRQHDIKVLGRGWVIESHFGELEGFVQLAADNGVVGQQPVIPPGACFEYYSCSSLKRFDAPGSMKGHLLVSLMGPAEQQQEKQVAEDAEDAAAAAESSGTGAQQQQQEDATSSSSSSSRSRAAAAEELEMQRVAVPVGVIKLQSPATAAAAVEAARMRAASGAESQAGEQLFGAAAAAAVEEEDSSSSSKGSDSSSSDDDSGKR